MKNIDEFAFKVIARIKSDFPDKFGIPRQSGLLNKLESTIIFEPEYRNANALRGLSGFSHLWILWIFSENIRNKWKPTVRPPRLGGNIRVGVFATRSSFRPNPIAMSCVKIERINYDAPNGPTICVSGADLMDSTPIVDIKPYLQFDCHPEAVSGFAENIMQKKLDVTFNADISCIPKQKLESLIELLSEDPRPAYQNDNSRIYGMNFAGFEIKFNVAKNLLTVVKIEKLGMRRQGTKTSDK